MNKIYDLYEALLTIKDYCISNEKCKDCLLTDNADCCIFIKDTASSNWKLVEPARRLYE